MQRVGGAAVAIDTSRFDHLCRRLQAELAQWVSDQAAMGATEGAVAPMAGAGWWQLPLETGLRTQTAHGHAGKGSPMPQSTVRLHGVSHGPFELRVHAFGTDAPESMKYA